MALAATGVIAGFLAGLLGVGGGIIIVPALFFLLQRFEVSAASAMSIATATSLATIVPTAFSSVRAHHAKGNVDTRILKDWGGPILLSSVVFGLIASRISGHYLTWLFGVIAIIASVNMWFRNQAKPLFSKLPNRYVQFLLAGSVGGLSVLVGLGGGVIGVPTLTLFNVAVHRAVGTAAGFGLLIALPAVLTILLFGVTPMDAPVGTWHTLSAPAFLFIVPLTVLFAPMGAKLGATLNAQQLKRAFALVLFITGLRMLFPMAGG